MFPFCHPVSEHMRKLSSRLASFEQSWSDEKLHTSLHQTAEAGFFFLGEHCCVKCWYYDDDICNWTTAFDPWVEHAKLSPTCDFLLQMKAPGFV